MEQRQHTVEDAAQFHCMHIPLHAVEAAIPNLGILLAGLPHPGHHHLATLHTEHIKAMAGQQAAMFARAGAKLQQALDLRRRGSQRSGNVLRFGPVILVPVKEIVVGAVTLKDVLAHAVTRLEPNLSFAGSLPSKRVLSPSPA